MNSPALAKAKLIPYDAAGSAPVEGDAIELDFNPHTLTIRVTNTLARPGRNGQQKRQYIGSTSSVLSFDAVFDTTRPPGPSGGDPKELDVRRKTSRIAALLRGADEQKEPAPRRVQFAWGNILFSGVMESFNETIEFFSPEGVPLRSKLSIALSEQNFEYQVAEEVSAQLASGGAGAGGAGSGGAGVGAGAGAGSGLDAGVGFGVDLGLSASAGIELSVGAALDVFGGASVQAAFGADVDLGLSASLSVGASVQAGASLGATGGGAGAAVASAVAAPTPTPWAPAGPVPGSQASALASAINGARAGAPASGVNAGGVAGAGAFAATEIGRRAPSPSGAASGGTGAQGGPGAGPLPVKGSPPLAAPLFGPALGAPVMTRAPGGVVQGSGGRGRRPQWEDAGTSGRAATPDSPAPPEGHGHQGGRGCSCGC